MQSYAVLSDAERKKIWKKRLSTKRFKVKQGAVIPQDAAMGLDQPKHLRSDFHIDQDRVVFSGAFRRLGRKTQVHPLARNDHTHNRLTHSVEVASVGRSLGNRIGSVLEQQKMLPKESTPYDIGSIVQVACLAHDIGNPPFGHTGEDALREWFRSPQNAAYLSGLSEAERLDIQTYEGNAHSLRIVSSLEIYTGSGGMRLSAAALGALVKYPWTSDHHQDRGKFNVYRTELDYFQAVADELDLPKVAENEWRRHPLSYLMEAADDICYAIVDLEDAVEMDILDVGEFERTLKPLLDPERPLSPNGRHPTAYCAAIRGISVGRCVEEVANQFLLHEADLLQGYFEPKDLIQVCPSPVKDALLAAKELASRRIYRHKSKLTTEVASYPCLGQILQTLVPATYAQAQGQTLNYRQKLHLNLMERPPLPEDSLYQAYMKVLDFIGGLTDNAAAKLARDISGLGIQS